MTQFYPLTIREVRRETPLAVSVVFDIPDELKEKFRFTPGQYITVKVQINGNEYRRSYSICSSPDDNELRIAVKEIPNGTVSSYFNRQVQAGEVMDVMPPQGNFLFPADSKNVSLVLFAAGSGITPIMSILKTAVKESTNTIQLYYSNKTDGDTIFKKEIDELNNRYTNLTIHYIYTQQQTADDLYFGRINKEKCSTFINRHNLLNTANQVYVCGPEELIFSVKEAFLESGLPEENIHFELFTAPVKEDKKNSTDTTGSNTFSGEAEVTVIMDGEEFHFTLPADGENILDAAIEHGVDAPFSCKGAVCCTCKAKVMEGKAVMDMNYALTDGEVEQGYILTCQAHPASPKIVVDYDEI